LALAKPWESDGKLVLASEFMKNALPTALKKTENRSLQIQWSDGQTLEYPFSKLRDACPCATCKERKKADSQNGPGDLLKILKPGEARELDVLEMRPVGNYAYNITFSDGHSSGLFTMELLRELGLPCSEPCQPPPT
jgi:DUF971 family protein